MHVFRLTGFHLYGIILVLPYLFPVTGGGGYIDFYDINALFYHGKCNRLLHLQMAR